MDLSIVFSCVSIGLYRTKCAAVVCNAMLKGHVGQLWVSNTLYMHVYGVHRYVHCMY